MHVAEIKMAIFGSNIIVEYKRILPLSKYKKW